MSREVDQRIVEMQFNNADFERNTKKTIGLIDKLMEKLQFKGAEKGFEKLDAAAEKVDFDTMSRSLDDLQSKFSALDIIAATALVNITNKAVNAGEKLVKSLSVDQIASGWDKYTEKTSNVQTIMNATGKSIDQVNGYLNKLMWYSDETSYSFNEMTSALSQMTAAGGNIDKMIPMIMGIANATADAGKTGFAFQSTIRNLTQSYSAGHLQLQDWKSLNLMGTATKALKQELIDTAVELGKIKEGDVTIASFESSLSDKWADTQVMEKTFAKYSSMMEAAYQLTQKNKGMTSSEALEQLSGQYGELAERAALAAQQATSFAQAIDSTKDAVSSKWMSLFETIFGNKEEATETWTELANRLYDVFVPSIDALNERMKEGMDTGWQQLNDRMGDQAGVYDAVLQKVALANGAVTEEAIQSAGSFAKAMEQGGVDANLLQQSLDGTIASLKERLALSDKELDKRNLDRDAMQQDYDALCKVNDEIRNGSLNLDQYAKAMSQVSGRQHLMQSLWNVWDAIAKIMGSIKGAFDEIFPPKSGDHIYTLAERMDELTKKLIISDETAEQIKMTFQGVFSVVKVGTTLLKTLGRIGVKAFGLLANAAVPVGDVLLSISAGMGTFLTRVYEVLTGSGSLTDKFNGLKDAAKQLLKPLDGLADALRNTSLGKAIDELLAKGEQAEGLLGGLYPIGKNAFGKLSALVQGVAGGSVTVLGALGMAISGLISRLGSVGELATNILGRQLPTLEELGAMIGEMPRRLDENIRAFATGFSSSMDRITTKAGDAFAPVSAFFTALKEGFDAISGTDIYRFLSLLDVGLLAVAINQVAKAMASLKKMLQTPLTAMLEAMTGSFKALTNALKTWQRNEAAKTLTGMATALLILSGAMLVMSRIDADRFATTVLATIGLIGALTIAAKSLQPEVKALGQAMDGIKSQLLNAATLWGAAAALVGLGIAVGSITKGLNNLMQTMQQGDFSKNMAGLGSIIAGLAIAISLMGKLTATLKVGDKVINHKVLLATAVELLALSTAVKILSTAMKPLSEIKFTSLAKAGMAVAGLAMSLTAMASALAVIQGVAGPLWIQNGVALTAMASGIWIIAQAVGSLAKINYFSLDAAMTSMKTIMLLLTVMATVSRKTHFGSGAGIFLMASALGVLAGAVGLFAVMGDSAIDGLQKVIVALTALTAASSLSTGSAGAGAGILAMAAALYVLAGAVERLANIQGLDLIKGGTSAVLGLIALCAALTWISKLNIDKTLGVISKSMVTFSIALGVLSLAIHGFDGVTLGQVGAALVTFGGAIGTVCIVAAAAGYFAPLAKGLEMMAKAFDHFGGGALKLAGAMAIFGVLSMFAGPVCTAIINAAPDITQALISMVTMICDVIVACAEPLSKAFFVLATILIQTAIDLIGWAWDGGETGNGGIQGALETLWGQISDWLAQHTIQGQFQNWLNQYIPEGTGLLGLIFGQKGKVGKDEGFEELGENAADGWIQGTQNKKADVEAAGEEMAKTAIEATAEAQDSHSPSKAFEQLGQYCLEGYALGLENTGLIERCKSSMLAMAQSIRNVFTGFWQIHSPSQLGESDAEYIAEGVALGIADKEKAQQVRDAAYDLGKNAESGLTKALGEAKTAVGNAWNSVISAFSGGKWDTTEAGQKVVDAVTSFSGGITNSGILPVTSPQSGNWWDKTLDDFDSYYQKTADTVTDAVNTATGSTKSKSGSKGKTAAQTIAEEYTKQLKANKYLQDALSKETTLWNLTNEDAVSNEELIAKRTETVAKQIELQTDRVRIAQEQYDTLVKRVGASDDKTKDAYNTLLDEQASLEKLKASRYDDIWEDVLKRYENDSKTAEDEYKLWASLYEDTASVTEAANRKMEQINKKIEAQAKVVTAAEDEYTQLKAEFGEQSQKTQEAYRKYLEEQKDQQDLINELEKAQLEQFDNQIARYQREAKIVQNRQQMLAKIYNDGDLSGREDAYTSAVEKYGEGSKQARQAALQGTMSSLISVGTAMTNMSSSLKQLTEYQKTYDYYVAKGEQNSDDALDALSALQSEQYNFVGFAENLADAFDMTDNGKKAMMQLGYTISKNWKPIQNGFNKVWNRVQQNFPETAKKLTATLNLAMSEGAAETASSFMQTIVAAMSGDYATAIVSGLNTVLSFMNTEFGKAVLQGLAGVFAKAMTGLSTGGFFTKLLGKLFGSKGVASAVAQTAQVAAQTAQIAQSTGETAAAVTNAVAQTAQVAKGGGFLAKILGFLGKAGTAAKVGLGKAVGLVGAKFAALTATGGPLAGIAAALSSTGPIGIAVAALIAGGGLVIANWSKVKQWFSNFGSWMKDKFSKLWSGAKGLISGAVGVGKNILGGLWKGVKTVAGGLWNGIKSIGKGIINGFKSLFGIHSPSTVFAEIGQYMMLGLQNGISSNAQGVNRTLEDVSDGALGVAMDCSKRLLAATDEAMEYQPTIQPLVDLSNVQAGAAWLDENLSDGVRRVGFDLDRSAQLADIVSRRDEARKAALWQKDEPKTEEMSNKDIVEAIGTLGGRIDSVAEAVSRMKLSINGKKFVGGIINDVDEGLGKIASRNRR
jgi:hypothetical protein|nr:MAG TPA: tail tape measure [Caudoviricetes sp.]